jgi:hypothetical protein
MAAGAQLTDRAERLLNESIPDRVAELCGCARIIEACENQDPSSGATIQLSDTVTVKCSSARLFLLFPCLDAAIITCRNLMQLLGIGLSGNGQTLVNYQSRKFPTDAWMTDFGLQPVPKDKAYKGHDPLTEAQTERILLLVLQAGNKGIAHLTDKSTRDTITRREVAEACGIVITLVNHHIYKALGRNIIALPSTQFGEAQIDRQKS